MENICFSTFPLTFVFLLLPRILSNPSPFLLHFIFHFPLLVLSFSNHFPPAFPLRWLHQLQWLVACTGHLGHVPFSGRLPLEEPQRGHSRSRHHVVWPEQAAAGVHDPGVGRPVGHLQQRGGGSLHQGTTGRASFWRQEHRPPVLLSRLPWQHHRHGGQV